MRLLFIWGDPRPPFSVVQEWLCSSHWWSAFRPIGLPGCRLLGARGGPAGAGCSSATADRHLYGSGSKIPSQAISEPGRYKHRHLA
jgi:hypothetical protein